MSECYKDPKPTDNVQIAITLASMLHIRRDCDPIAIRNKPDAGAAYSNVPVNAIPKPWQCGMRTPDDRRPSHVSLLSPCRFTLTLHIYELELDILYYEIISTEPPTTKLLHS